MSSNISLGGIRPIDFKRFENLTLENLYHPTLNFYFYRFTMFLTVINSVITPIMIYIIERKSTKNMGNYKHLLAFQIGINYAFNFITFLWNPIFFWPLLLGYSAGPLDISPTTSYIILYIELMLMFYLGALQVYLILSRYVSMFQTSFIHMLYQNKLVMYVTLLMALIASGFLALSKFWKKFRFRRWIEKLVQCRELTFERS